MNIKIEKMIFEGWGIGHDTTGKAVMVKKSVPGDTLEVKITKNKANYSEAVIEKVIDPSPLRITPKCHFFNLCGGCDHQNIAYPDQLKLKEALFSETLSRANIDTDILPIVQAGEPVFYRNSNRFAFKIDDNNTLRYCRHNYLYRDGLVEVKDCLLESETANKIVETFVDFINNNIEDKSSFWQIKIREGKMTDEFMVEIITSSDQFPQKQKLVDLLAKISGVRSIYQTVATNKSLKHLQRYLLYGSPVIFEKIGRFNFQISPDSFFQTNSLGVKTLYDKIKDFADIKPGDDVLDLFCGTGSIGIYLSTLAKKVTGVEIVQNAINDAKSNAKINKIQNCDFICANAKKWLAQNYNHQFNKIVVDPPRAGLDKEIIGLLSRFSISIDLKIVYVSCNPATFSRDIIEFEKQGLVLKKVQPIDMFPQTHHIECVGLIQKNNF